MNPIDAVISWVDGNEPSYQQKLKNFCDEQGITQQNAIEPTRINQSNEIHYCLHSLRRFAPWIRTIYIVTNQQIPPTVDSLKGSDFGSKIKIIDQNDLLNESGATSPVFNSLSVEWLIWRIKGLSDNFLYLNDDFFIIRDVTPDDFFKNKKMVLRGEWKVKSYQKLSYKIKTRLSKWLNGPEVKPKTNPHRSWQEKSASIAGFNRKFYLLPHAPFPLFKDTFNQHLADKPNLLAENISHPFRSPKHISSIPLMVHLDLKQNRTTYDTKKKTIMVNGASHKLEKIKSRLHQAKTKQDIAFVCMQSIDQAPPQTQKYMLDWLNQCID
jgi:hypothetical protein